MANTRNEIKSLRVIEVWIQAGAPCFRPLSKKLLALTNAFRPESCIRHVYIYKDSQDSFSPELQSLLEEIRANTAACKTYSGEAAYSFLLSWIVGGEYREKKPGSLLPLFNDNHIMGRFKLMWNVFLTKNQDNNKKDLYVKIVNLLLSEAHQIRQRIEAGTYGENEVLRGNLDVAIANIIYSHHHGLPVAYAAVHKSLPTYLQTIDTLLYKTIQQKQSQISCKSENIDLQQANKAIFGSMMQLIYQKRLLSDLMQTPADSRSNTKECKVHVKRQNAPG